MSNLPQKDHTPPQTNLPGYQAKVNLLRQIDDAASQYGGGSRAPSDMKSNSGNRMSDLNRNRGAQARQAGNMMLSSGKHNAGGIRASDLNSLNQGDAASQQGKEDLRSVRSEYDYGNKKKFVDILGNFKKNNLNANGLSGLGELGNHPGAKNMETASRNSKQSMTSSFKKRYNAILHSKPAGHTLGEIDERQEMEIIDKDGNRIILSPEQISLLEVLAKQQDLANITEQQQELLKNINLDDLNMMDVQQINEILDQNGIQIPYQSKVVDRTNKRLYSFNQHSNSDEYKNLGTLHKDKRVVEYYPQDDKQEFSTKPQIIGTKTELSSRRGGQSPEDYSYETGGLSYSHRVPQHLIGHQASNVRQHVDTVNDRLMLDKLSDATGSLSIHGATNFPKTTNQDFHNDDVFNKAQAIGRTMDKQNFKKVNVYSSYVNAMFNSGVFTNPWQKGIYFDKRVGNEFSEEDVHKENLLKQRRASVPVESFKHQDASTHLWSIF